MDSPKVYMDEISVFFNDVKARLKEQPGDYEITITYLSVSGDDSPVPGKHTLISIADLYEQDNEGFTVLAIGYDRVLNHMYMLVEY